MKRFFFFAFLLLLVTCTTYDSALIYKKNFQPGAHPLLRFDGYYRDIETAEYSLSARSKPFFFYANGSAFVTEKLTTEPLNSVWVKTAEASGSWGNYKISADTIYLERFFRNDSEDNHERMILKGIVEKDKIRWTHRKERNQEYMPVNYSVTFTPLSSKPDSTKNWIRTMEKYNK